MIAASSYENIISKKVMEKLKITIKWYPMPYKLAWLKRGGELTVSKHVLVTFSIGTKYRDEMWSDLAPMDARHLLLGRPWQYDWRVVHNGRANAYSFTF